MSEQRTQPYLFSEAVEPNARTFSPNLLGAGPKLVEGGRELGIGFGEAQRRMLNHYGEENRSREDVIRPLSSLKLHQMASGEVRTLGDCFRFRSRGISDLCTAVGAPWKYLRELPTETAISALNHSIQNAPNREVKLRLATSPTCSLHQVRSIVGPRYTVFDLPDWLGALRGSLTKMGLNPDGDVKVLHARIGATHAMHLTTSVSRHGPDGYSVVECLKAGNGEGGNRAVDILAGLFRPICTNGMFSTESFSRLSRNHRGSLDDMASFIAHELPRLLEAAQHAAQLVSRSGAVSLSKEQAEALLASLDLPAKTRKRAARVAAAEATERWIKERSPSYTSPQLEPRLVDPASDEVYDELAAFTAWDIVNGLTQVAQSQETSMRRRMESQAFDVLSEVHHSRTVPLWQ